MEQLQDSPRRREGGKELGFCLFVFAVFLFVCLFSGVFVLVLLCRCRLSSAHVERSHDVERR